MYQWNNTRIGKYETFHIHVKHEHGYSPKYTEHVFSVVGLSLHCHGFGHKLRQITNCDGSIAICDGSKHNFSDRFHSNRGYTPKCRKHVYILIGQFQEGFLFASFKDLITDIHRNRYTIKKTPKWAKMQFFIFMSKVNLGNQYATLRPWSQIATNHKLRRQGFLNCRNLWLSQFVTVQNTTSQIDFLVTEGMLLSAENMFTSTSDHIKKVSWVHRLWAL